MNAIDKLRVLLPHWQAHNEEHAGEFQTWAERAREAGETHLAEHIEAAALRMKEANHDLAHAIELVGGEAGGHDASDHHHHHHHDHSH